MNILRRNFIKKSSLGIVGLGIANSLLGQIVTSVVSKSTETILEMLTRARILRKQAGGLNDAYDVYQDILTIDATEIRAYNGLRKILLQSKYKEMEILDMYSDLSDSYPSIMFFKTRAAKEYMRLALGHKKYAETISGQYDLLESARQIFYDAKVAEPLNKQYEAQYKKALNRLDLDVTIDARNNSSLRSQKRANRKVYKNRFDDYNSWEVRSRLDNLLAKPANKDRMHHIRDTYRILINKHLSGKIPDAIEVIKELYAFDKSDPNGLYLARKICNKYGYYQEIVAIEEENNDLKKDFWSTLALFDAKLKLYDKEKIGNIGKIDDLYKDINLPDAGFSVLFEIKTRGIKLAFLKHDFTIALTNLIALSKLIKGVSSAHLIDRFNNLCVQYYKKTDDPYKAMMVVNIALRENNLPLSDQLLQMIESVNKKKVVEKPVHNERLRILRNQLAN